MVTINTIVSMAQNAIFDLERARVQEGEWVDMVISAMLEIGRRAHGYVGRQTTVPVPLVSSPVVSSVEVAPAASPYLITRVLRTDGNESVHCEEISTQAVLNTQQTIYTFRINRTHFNTGSFSTKLQGTDEAMDNTITLIFPKPFDVGETVIIDYIGLRPFVWSNWNLRVLPEVGVPDWYEGALRYKVFSLVFELLFNRGDQFYYSRMQEAKREYEIRMTELEAYSRLLRNKGDVMRARPLNWLEE